MTNVVTGHSIERTTRSAPHSRMMPEHRSEPHCPRCGEIARGRFCASCGAAVGDVHCPSCGHAVPAGAHFCAECGSAIAAGAAHPTGATRSSDHLPRLIGGAALIALVAFVAGLASGRRSNDAVAADAQLAGAPANAGIVPAPDISAMSPDERASRLFNRVMSYSEQGKADSARFFAPMAIQAYEMLGPVNPHVRYDIGTISAAVGDVARARAEADTILRARPNHLLGLVLAIRSADLAGDAAAASRFRRQLVAAAPAERPTQKEYAEHARDIDEALAKAGATR